ncbi:class III extradiol ring-cleavage dioxygenase [Paenibacillus sp. JX-17]|uniref:Class III extradiol ring-cleavage dioxygenase n=1 Tax=Paenibacillus lacisoli TaxID=3064525 RepID=A0ABT9CDS4_9BACL|nr:class III extradiol ring-cleavage dioxygenase [Paenibacillus sp. JX-17]MDO7906728.1 class III extradiol ring-cleavage dioxygenase [Paenibacillus sp. JX-17]
MISPIFLAHGSPMTAIEQSPYTKFLDAYGQTLHPKAIVIFTAHWESPVLTVTSTDDVYETIYDFGGFPPELYAVQYPARGSVSLAERLTRRFEAQGIDVRKDERRGLDHGSWTLLHRLFPAADIPVVQISVHPFLPPTQQLAIGEALRGLDAEDILIIGSGVTVHNLRMVDWDAVEPTEWAVQFDDWLIEQVQSWDTWKLDRYRELAPHAVRAVPREEHFVPLFLAMGSSTPDRKPEILHRSYQMGTLSYLSFSF